MTPERFLIWSSVVSVLTTALSVAGYKIGWLKVYVPVREFFRTMKTEQKRQGDELNDQSAILQNLQKEVTFNGGESMKDEVRQNARDVRVLKHFMWMADPRARAEWRFKMAFNSVGAKEIRWYCNRVTERFSDLTGLTAEACNNDGWLDAVSDAHRDEVMRQVERCQKSNAIFSCTYPLRYSGVMVYHRAEPIFDRDGSVFSWVVEITEVVPEERRIAGVVAA